LKQFEETAEINLDIFYFKILIFLYYKILNFLAMIFRTIRQIVETIIFRKKELQERMLQFQGN